MTAPAAAPPPLLALAGVVSLLAGIGLTAASILAPEAVSALYGLFGPAHPPEFGPAARIGAAISGALTAGVGLACVLLARQRPTAQVVGGGLALWFVLDGAASLILGYPWNVLSNALLCLPFGPTLWAAFRRPTR